MSATSTVSSLYVRVETRLRDTLNQNPALGFLTLLVLSGAPSGIAHRLGHETLGWVLTAGGVLLFLWCFYVYDTTICDCGERVGSYANFCEKCGRPMGQVPPDAWMADSSREEWKYSIEEVGDE